MGFKWVFKGLMFHDYLHYCEALVIIMWRAGFDSLKGQDRPSGPHDNLFISQTVEVWIWQITSTYR
jgi:hypothetical protein